MELFTDALKYIRTILTQGVTWRILDIKLLAHMLVSLLHAIYIKRKYMTFREII